MKLFVRKHGRQVASSGRIGSHYYASAKKQSVEPPIRASRSTSRLKQLRNLLVGFVAIVILYFVLSLNRQPSVSVDSEQYRSVSDYTNGVSKSLDGLSSRSKLTLNRAAIMAKIQNQFPEVDQVSVSTPIYSRTAKVKLHIAPPAFALSAAPGTFGESENIHYIIANNGKVSGLSQNFPKINYKDLPNLTDQSDYQIKPGELVLGQGTSGFILAIYDQCQKNNIPIASFNLANNSQEVDLRTKDKSYYVKFSLASDPATQVGQFIAARNQLAKSGEPSEYLDVRVDGRIFYK